jgi:large subunit ribosomal protein L18
MPNITRKASRERLHKRVRQRIHGTSQRPRLSVCFTGRHIYVQVIDDETSKTLASVHTTEKSLRAQPKTGASVATATQVGKLIAERAGKASIQAVVFDRGGFKYHGKVKALADAAREGGLQF